MLLDNEFTGDMRVENEVRSLQKKGHKVTVLSLNFGNCPNEEIYHGAKIIRIPVSLKWKKRMKGLSNTWLDLYTQFWSYHLTQYLQNHHIDALHIHDLYLVGAGLKTRRKGSYSFSIVADLHENYPAALENYSFVKKFPAKYIVSIKKWRETEKKWLQEVDRVITVIEEAKQRYQSIGIDPNQIYIVPNYVAKEEFLSTYGEASNQKYSSTDKSFTATYIGGFDIHRGLETVVEAIPKINQKIDRFKLVLVGSGANMDDLKRRAQSLKVEHQISFEGWQKPAMLPRYIEKSDICLIPHLKTEHTDHTIPHKLFQYFLLQKPVIVSDCAPLKRIVEDTQAGYVFPSQNVHKFAETMIKAHQNLEQLNTMGKLGEKAVHKYYNWTTSEQNLLALYHSLS